MNLRSLITRFANLFRRSSLDRDLAAEISSHLDLAIEENLRSGLSPQEARRQALIQFGGTQQAKESARDERSLPFLETLFQDARFSLRLLKKSPAFTSVAVLTLALGIGATTAIFSVVYGVLLRPLPYKNPQQIVRLWEQNASGDRMSFADPNFLDLRAQNHSLSGAAEYESDISTVCGQGEPSRTQTAAVSQDFFNVMGVQPIFGRGFEPDDQRLDAPAVALVSYAYWQQSLGSTQDLSSVHLKISNKPASVVGVLPPGFRFPDNSDIWLPRELVEMLPSRTAHNWRLLGRLRDGVTVDRSRAELSAIAQRMKQQYGEDTAMVAVAIEPLREALTSDVRPALLILLGASAFLLLIACANVTNLMLAQAAGRERELAIRAALGAQRYRLLRQFLTEAFLLAVIGGVLGIVLAYWGLNGLLALAPANLPRLENISLNLPVLLFSLASVFLVSMALASFTSLRSVLRDSRDALGEGNRGGIGTRNKQRMGRVLAAAQLAIALVLLVGASLLGQSLLRVLSVNSGFRTESILTMDLRLPDDAPKPERIAFLDKLLAQLRQIPGVSQVGGTNNLPLSGTSLSDGSFVLMNPGQLSPHTQELIHRSVTEDFQTNPALLAELTTWFEDLVRDKSHLGYADFVVASDGFFKALDIPLLQGRLFDDRDTIDSPHVALISQSAANDRWPGQDPVGRTIEFGNMDGDLRLLTIVGVVGDIRDRSLEAASRPTVYVSYRQRPIAARRFTIVMRASSKPDTVFSSARSMLRDIDPNIPPSFRTLSQVYSSSLDARRFSLTLVAIFSAVAFLLALAGIYGVISYSVAQRTREIGVRMALGATTREVLAMVLKQGARTGAIGIFFGLLGAFAVTRWLQSQLFEISPTDPATLVIVSLALLLVSLAACAIPGRRATRIDPVIALRCE
jgi:ABC-type antimicrobial peptide transport system permease subunit